MNNGGDCPISMMIWPSDSSSCPYLLTYITIVPCTISIILCFSLYRELCLLMIQLDKVITTLSLLRAYRLEFKLEIHVFYLMKIK